MPMQWQGWNDEKRDGCGMTRECLIEFRRKGLFRFLRDTV